MKSIEEKAREHSKKVNGEYYDELFPDSDLTIGEISENDYTAGFKYAHQWISVEDELPEIKDKPYQVLVKSITGHMETYHVIDRKSQHFIKEFIEWRPIEFK